MRLVFGAAPLLAVLITWPRAGAKAFRRVLIFMIALYLRLLTKKGPWYTALPVRDAKPFTFSNPLGRRASKKEKSDYPEDSITKWRNTGLKQHHLKRFANDPKVGYPKA